MRSFSRSRLSALMMSAALAAVALAPIPLGAAPAPETQHDYHLLPAGDYAVDKTHATITGTILHDGLTLFPFNFSQYDAKLTYDAAHPENSRVEATIEIATFDAVKVEEFVTRLRGPGYFNVEKYPEAKFVSTGLKILGNNKGVMTGDLTFMGVTKPVSLDVIFDGLNPTPKGGARIGFDARTTLKRSDFNLHPGDLSLGDDVALTIAIEFTKA